MEAEERIAELYNECDVLYHRAMACLDKKDYDMAFSLFMEAVNFHDELGESHDDTLDFRVNIVHELFTTKRFYEASQFDATHWRDLYSLWKSAE